MAYLAHVSFSHCAHQLFTEKKSQTKHNQASALILFPNLQFFTFLSVSFLIVQVWQVCTPVLLFKIILCNHYHANDCVSQPPICALALCYSQHLRIHSPCEVVRVLNNNNNQNLSAKHMYRVGLLPAMTSSSSFHSRLVALFLTSLWSQTLKVLNFVTL